MDLMRVITAGLSSTVQDGGRTTGMAQGVPPSGAADLYSYRLSNLVLGNPPGCGVIEMAAHGDEMEVLEDCVIAFTGADLSAQLDGRTVPLGEPVYARAGARISRGAGRRGIYAYLAVAGGFAGSVSLGSRSTYTVGMLGGCEGRRLVAGDLLARERDPEPFVPIAGAGEVARELAAPPGTIRIIPGPQSHYFEPESYEILVHERFSVSNRSDRMAFRLLGPAPVCADVPRTPDTGSGSTDIVEEGNPVGGIQVAGGTELICLGRDCGTSGGYAKIGTIIGRDMSRMAQLGPDDRFNFTIVDITEAAAARDAADRLLDEVATLGDVTTRLGSGATALVGATWSEPATRQKMRSPEADSNR